MSATTATGSPSAGDLYVSTEGEDSWSGTAAQPNDDGTDGPFATIRRAKRAVRERKADAELDGSLTVWLRGGAYRLEEPLTFEPADSAPVTYAAYPGEEPVITGDQPVEGWAETEINGITAWKTTINEVAAGERYYRSLFVNGERRRRPRLPKAVDEVFEDGQMVTPDEERFYHFQPGTQKGRGKDVRTFEPEAGSIDPGWRNRDDVDVVAINKWYDERAPIGSVETKGGSAQAVITAFRPYYSKEWQDRFYYVENVFEALSEPGQWYLDRETGECYYIPREGESIDAVTITVPQTRRLLEIRGNPTENRYVEFVGFKGVTFARTEWDHWIKPDWNTGQSAAPTTGVITLAGARNCRLEECTVRTTGEYALDIRDGCTGLRVIECELADLGAGGIKMGSNESDPDGSGVPTGNNRLVDNHIHDGGRVFHMGAGILATDTYGNLIAHNHIHDLYYSAISVGWNWGYEKQIARDNHVEYNDIHDLGKNLLSDMAGVYTLGMQPGTVIRLNHVRDVWACDYGGWGLYTDEGSSHIVLEKNLVHDTNKQGFHQHFGRENIIRNNIFAFGEEGQIALSRTDGDHRPGFTFERNIVITDDEPLFLGGYDSDLDSDDLISDLNLFWDVEGRDLVWGEHRSATEMISLEAWRERGHDRHSIVADPDFADLADRDFDLSEDSPALEAGFEPFDLSAVGQRR